MLYWFAHGARFNLYTGLGGASKGKRCKEGAAGREQEVDSAQAGGLKLASSTSESGEEREEMSTSIKLFLARVTARQLILFMAGARRRASAL